MVKIRTLAGILFFIIASNGFSQSNPQSGALPSVHAGSDTSPEKNKHVFLKSLIIPGWGQKSLGAKVSARNFFVTEVLLLGSAFGLNAYSKWLKSDMQAFAAHHAGVQNAAVKDDKYWVDIGNFNTIDLYNEEKLRQRYTPFLRARDGDEFWSWDSETNRREFEQLRIKKDRMAERSSFLVAAIISNHVISALHATYRKRKQDATMLAQRQTAFYLTSDFSGTSPDLKLNLFLVF